MTISYNNKEKEYSKEDLLLHQESIAKKLFTRNNIRKFIGLESIGFGFLFIFYYFYSPSLTEKTREYIEGTTSNFVNWFFFYQFIIYMIISGIFIYEFGEIKNNPKWYYRLNNQLTLLLILFVNLFMAGISFGIMSFIMGHMQYYQYYNGILNVVSSNPINNYFFGAFWLYILSFFVIYYDKTIKGMKYLFNKFSTMVNYFEESLKNDYRYMKGQWVYRRNKTIKKHINQYLMLVFPKLKLVIKEVNPSTLGTIMEKLVTEDIERLETVVEYNDLPKISRYYLIKYTMKEAKPLMRTLRQELQEYFTEILFDPKTDPKNMGERSEEVWAQINKIILQWESSVVEN